MGAHLSTEGFSEDQGRSPPPIGPMCPPLGMHDQRLIYRYPHHPPQPTRTTEELPSEPVSPPGYLDEQTASLPDDGLLARFHLPENSSAETGVLGHILLLLGKLAHRGPQEKNISVAERAIANLLQRQEYIIHIARAETMFGASLHRIEDTIYRSAALLSVPCTFIALPNYIVIVFSDPSTHTSEARIYRTPVIWSLGRLELVDTIIRQVFAHTLSPAKASKEIQAILAQGPGWHSTLVTAINWVIVAACMSPVVYGGGWKETGVSAALGILVWGLFWARARLSTYAELFETVAAVMVSFITTALRHHVCYVGIILSPLGLALPGFSLIIATMEIFSRRSAQGAGRIVYAITRTYILGYGMALGQSLWFVFSTGSGSAGNGDDLLSVGSSACGAEIGIQPKWALFLVVLPILACGFSIFLQASFRQMPRVILSAVPAYLVNFFVVQYVQQTFIARAAAGFTIGFLSNLQAKIFNRIAFVPLLPSILMLVPGSFGVRGALSLASGGPSSIATSLTVEMLMIALGVTAGLFLGSIPFLILKRRDRDALMML